MKFPRVLFLIAATATAGLLLSRPATAEYATIRGTPVTQGQMRIAEPDLEHLEGSRPTVTDQLILKQTRVDAEISGVLARVRVEQEFQNPYPERLEAIYVFPLPEDAAVDRYWFQIGDQVIQGVVKEREEARREYQRARDEGRKASLLEQERANVFTQSVANIPAGQTVVVHIEYVHPVDIDGDRCVFRFPMVVGPRYIPGQPLARPNVGRGWAPDTDQVADASRVTPPTLPAGMRSGNDVSVILRLDAGMPIQQVTGVTHQLEVKQDEETKAVIRLKDQTTIPDKDFVVEYRLAGTETVLASLAHRSELGGYFALVLQPKRQVPTAELAPREVVLLLDTSGSMDGPAIGQLRIFAGHVLGSLNPQDTFRIVAFSNRPQAFHHQPLPATQDNVARGQQFIRGLQANGGTEMLPALQTALGASASESSQPRYLLLVTDALVGNDNSILGYLQRPEFSDVRVFPVAMGAAPNHYLIARAAEIKRGFSLQVTNQDNPAEMADRFNAKISAPYITDLEVDWGSLKVADVLPQPLPDLYADRPLVILGRYDQPGNSEIRLRGNLQGQPIETSLTMTLPDKEVGHDSLGPLWARQRIRHVWNRDLGQTTPQGREEITRLGLTHQLVTQYTSFVAVEMEASDVAQGPLRTESVPVMMPEGMKDESVGVPAARRNGQAGYPAAPPAAPVADEFAGADSGPGQDYSSPAPSGRSSGGGGSVEWIFLASLGALGGGNLISAWRRRKNTRN